jgi:hypothetical protein
MRKIFFIILSVLSTSGLFAQQTKKDKKEEHRQKINALIRQEEEGVITYTKHTAFGFKFTNDGYGGFMEVGRAQSISKSLLFQLDIAERKHTKEDKQTNQMYAGPSLIFGKINFFYPVKLGVQQQILLGNKSNKNGVSITANFGGGVSLGLLRPYYLDIFDTTSSPTMLYYLQATGPSFTKGWSNLKVTPGAYAKAAVRFDYGRYNEVVSAIEVGITAEFYAKKIPQLVYVAPKNLFVNLYVSVLFGKRK